MNCLHISAWSQLAVSPRSCSKGFSSFSVHRVSRNQVLRLPRAPVSRGRRVTRQAVPNWNPQNVPDPKVMPCPEFSPEESVIAQLEALKANDDPWTNHGLQTMYEFGADIGGMDRSRYFGIEKDLYHFDHFMGQFQNSFKDLVNLSSYSVKGCGEQPNESTVVIVQVEGSQGTVSDYSFVMQQKKLGRKKGSWMTLSLQKMAAV